MVVASNRAAAGVYEDTTGPLIVDALRALGFDVDEAVVRPDGEPVGAAIALAVRDGARVVLTTGGTGLTPTDQTPEVTRPLLDREVPGLAERSAPRASQRAYRRRPCRGVSRASPATASSSPARLPGRREGRARRAPAGAPPCGRAGQRERPLSSEEQLRRLARERMITSIPGRAWPNQPLSGTDPTVTLRPIRRSDARSWRETRRRNAAWLSQWEATVPPGATPAGNVRCRCPATVPRRPPRHDVPLRHRGRRRFAGQVSINNIVRGSAQFASVGYWISQEFAGRGVMPRAVAMAADHCFFTGKLHRLEVCIRPENTNSLRVVEKLGIREIGYAPRFLHIDGDWRDHRIFAITKEECPRGLLARLEESDGDASAAR